MSSKNDFDFLLGRWAIDNRMLKERLCGSNKWRRFEANLEVKKILSGTGSVSIFRAIINSRFFEGMMLRLFNPVTKLWSLHWVDNWSAVLQPPLIGEFTNGKGEFYCDYFYNDEPVKILHIWSNITSKSAHWEQAFSNDSGKTWETNWTMEFYRND